VVRSESAGSAVVLAQTMTLTVLPVTFQFTKSLSVDGAEEEPEKEQLARVP